MLAAFLGWFLDDFDQVVLLLVLPEIGKSFGVSLTAMGLVIKPTASATSWTISAGAGSPTVTAASSPSCSA